MSKNKLKKEWVKTYFPNAVCRKNPTPLVMNYKFIIFNGLSVIGFGNTEFQAWSNAYSQNKN